MQAITLPQKPRFVKIDEKTGKFIIEGCYPGYGTTLGNSLRRVLLSSLSGSAITSIKIKGISHEFSTIPNVLEDAIQIILNLKQVRFRMHSEEPIKVNLKAKGEKEVTASMIDCPSQVEVINGEAHIATLTSAKGEIEIEMEISNGIGYVPVEQQEREKKEVGIIAVDAIYTPVRRVNYTIDNMRVGKKTDFEKINLEISTDGTILPEEAFSKAVEILVNQFSAITTIKKEAKVKEKKEEKISKDSKEEDTNEEKEEKRENVEVTELKNLSTRTLNVLEKNSVKKVKDILKLSEDQLKSLEGMGDKGVKEIKKAIGDFGFNLRKE
jgi:DNA-directed RNA polymerase subunit alpha